MRTKSKSGLFLIELIIAILFFSVASAVCVRIFVSAHMLSEKSSNTSMAVVAAQSAAESLKGTNGSADKMAELLGATVGQGEDGSPILTVQYDELWNRAKDGAEPAYQMTVNLKESGNLVLGEIAVTALTPEEDSIYTLEVKKLIR